MSSQLIEQIRNQKKITFSYDGYFREVDAHTYGTTTTGKKAIRGYQTGGRSSSGRLPAWRLFLLEGMSNITYLDETFDIAPKYKRGDSGFDSIYVQV